MCVVRCERQGGHEIRSRPRLSEVQVGMQDKNHARGRRSRMFFLLCLFCVAAIFLLQGWCDVREVFAEDARRLTDDGQLKFSPVFTNEGRTIVYSVHHRPQRVVLMEWNVSDGSRELVMPAGTASQFDPDYSGDGCHLCYSRSGHDR